MTSTWPGRTGWISRKARISSSSCTTCAGIWCLAIRQNRQVSDMAGGSRLGRARGGTGSPDKIPHWPGLAGHFPGVAMSSDDDIVLVISNAPDLLLAKRIAHVLVEDGLAACVNHDRRSTRLNS